MRFSKENQPPRRRHTDEPREKMMITVKPRTRAYLTAREHKGEAGRVLDEYVNDKIKEE